MPVHVVREPVDVLGELPGEARLPDTGDARHRDEMGLVLVGRRVEEVLDETQLAIAADEGRLEADGAVRALALRDDPERPPQLDRLGLPLELVRSRRLVGDRSLARSPGCLADEHRARLGRGLHPRCRVDEIAGDHALTLGTERNRGLAGHHARAGGQLRRADLVAKHLDRGHEIERRPHGPLGVVLGRGRGSPRRHHGVADELLDRASVALDQRPGGLEVLERGARAPPRHPGTRTAS